MILNLIRESHYSFVIVNNNDKNRFNQAKLCLSTSRTHHLFLEDNDKVDMEKAYKIKNVQPPTYVKDAVNKEYCDNNLLSAYKKIYILSKINSELRKDEFEEVTDKTLQPHKTQVNDELVNF